MYHANSFTKLKCEGVNQKPPEIPSEMAGYFVYTKKTFISDGDYPLYSNHAGYTDDEIYSPLIVMDTNEENK